MQDPLFSHEGCLGPCTDKFTRDAERMEHLALSLSKNALQKFRDLRFALLERMYHFSSFGKQADPYGQQGSPFCTVIS